MSSYIANILCGTARGHLFQFRMTDLESKPRFTLLAAFSSYNYDSIYSLDTSEPYIAAGSGATKVNIWKYDSGKNKHIKVLKLLDDKNWEKVTALAFSDGFLYCGNPTGHIEIWDRDRKFKKTDEIAIGNKPITGIAPMDRKAMPVRKLTAPTMLMTIANPRSDRERFGVRIASK